ncbi:thiol-activated cytolysin family protein [Algoriphagus namhaensis]
MKFLLKNPPLFHKRYFILLGLCAMLSLNWSEAQIPRRKTVPTKPPTQTKVDPKKPTTTEPIQMVGTVNYIATVEPFEYFMSGSPTAVGGQKELLVVSDRLNDMQSAIAQPLSDKNTSTLFCKVERLDLKSQIRAFEEMPQGPRPDWLKPGIVLDARSFMNGTYTIEQRYDRSPITLSSSDLRGAINVTEVVNQPKHKSEIAQAENRLISQTANPAAANMTFRFSEIKSQEDLSFKLNGRYSGGLGSFAASIGVEAGLQKNFYYYLVEFNQFMFSIEVDGLNEAAVFNTTASVPTKDYVYISKVNYGRRGGILFKSKSSLEDLMVQLNLSSGFSGISKTQLNSLFEYAKESSEVEINAFMYGGSSESATRSIVNTLESGVPNIAEWIGSQPGNHTLALPIGFELKNLRNEQIGMKNAIRQDIETCVVKRDYRLKITLTDIQNVDGRDGGGDNPDDYGLQMGLVMKARNKVLPAKDTEFNKFPLAPCGFTSPGRKNIQGPYFCLIGGGMDKQIHVRENRNARDINQIVNSLTFDLSWEDYIDPNHELRIYTWLKEYTSSNDKVIHDDDIQVELKDVLDILAGNKALQATRNYPDGQIAQGGLKFHDFGEKRLWLTEAETGPGRYVLEGPIRAGKPGEKAAIWVRFELLN